MPAVGVKMLFPLQLGLADVEVNAKLEFISTSWMYLRFKKPPTVDVFRSWSTNK